MSLQNYTWVEISKDALRNNVQQIKKHLPSKVKLMAVVKSNAYGHGLIETAKIFIEAGADWLGVFDQGNGVELRKSDIKNPLLIFGPSRDAQEAIENDIQITISNFKNIPVGSNVHVKIDTGLSRQGVLPKDVEEVIKNVPDGISIRGIYTHLADADNLDDLSYTKKQLEIFDKALEIAAEHGYKPIGHVSASKALVRHTLASEGLFTVPKATYDMVRVGVLLYGLPPDRRFLPHLEKWNIKPALSFKTKITELKNIEKGTPVGYGLSEKVLRDSRIAILPIGYWDGYDRGLSSKAEVLVRGKRCKVLGRVFMNMIVVDITDVPGVKLYDTVTLIGRDGKEEISALELAEHANSITYEIVTRINPLIKRIYV